MTLLACFFPPAIEGRERKKWFAIAGRRMERRRDYVLAIDQARGTGGLEFGCMK